MRKSDENEEISEHLLHKVTCKHIWHSILIAVVCAFGLYFLYSNFVLEFLETNQLILRLSILSVMLFVGLVITMIYMTKIVVRFFDFHTGIEEERERIRQGLGAGNLADNALSYYAQHLPIAEAVAGIHSYGAKAVKERTESTDKKINDIISTMSEPVREFNKSIIGFIMESPAYKGMREKKLGRRYDPEQPDEEPGNDVVFEEWKTKLDDIGEYLIGVLLEYTRNVDNFLIEKKSLKLSNDISNTLFKCIYYTNAALAAIVLKEISVEYFEMRIVEKIFLNIDRDLEAIGFDSVSNRVCFSDYFDGLSAFHKEASEEFGVYVVPGIYLTLFLSLEVDEGLGQTIEDLLPDIFKIQEKLLVDIDNVVDGINFGCDYLDKAKPDPKYAASLFLRDFSYDFFASINKTDS